MKRPANLLTCHPQLWFIHVHTHTVKERFALLKRNETLASEATCCIRSDLTFRSQETPPASIQSHRQKKTSLESISCKPVLALPQKAISTDPVILLFQSLLWQLSNVSRCMLPTASEPTGVRGWWVWLSKWGMCECVCMCLCDGMPEYFWVLPA